MAREKRTFRLGDHVTVTASEQLASAVTEQVRGVIDEVFGRPRARRTTSERLSADRIVDVAIAQMREHGYDAVTMRSLAKELGTGPASLYAHVANRAELDQLVLGRVTGQLRVPDPDPERWDEQLRQAARDLLELFRAHPGVARCSLGTIPTSVESLVTMERLLAIVRASGASDQDVAWFADAVALYVTAIAVEEDLWRLRAGDAEPGEDAMVGQVDALFSSLPAEHFPTITSMAHVLTQGSGQDRFEFGVDLLVEGLRARAR